MNLIKINIKDFSSYTLTNLFYEISPIVIIHNKFALKILCHNLPFSFRNIKELKSLGTIKGWQELPFVKKNNNFYTTLNR